MVVLALMAVHAAVALAFPISGDEAYYWDCARHLDWSTFDQPPLAIWTIAAARWVLGDSQLAVRAPALLAGLIIAVTLLPLVRRLGGSVRDTTRVWLWLHVLPLFALGLSYASTDVAMAAAYVVAILAIVAIVQGRRAAWWGLGIALGLGFLAKYPIITALLPASVALLSPRVRADLRTPVPWLAALLSFLLTLPVWIWGARNQWDNLAFQLSWRHSPRGLTSKYLLEFIGANIGLASPVLAVLLIGGLWRALGHREVEWRVLVAAALAPFLFFGFVALRTRVGAHWGAPGLVILVVLFVLTGFGGPRVRRIAAAVGVVLSASVLTLLAAPGLAAGFDWAYEERSDKIRTSKLVRIVGNEAIAAAVEARRDAWAEELGVPNREIYIGSESYSAVHLLAFYSGGRLDTRLVRLTAGQHGLASLYWYEEDEFRERRFLMVSEKSDWRLPLLVDEIHEHFGQVEEAPPIVVDTGKLGSRTLRVWHCSEPLDPALMFTREAVRAEQAF